MALTEKRRRFVEEYLKDLNGKQAAIRAGYAPASAEVEASRLLRDAKVAAAIEEAAADRSARVAEGHGVTVDRVVLELAKIGFADIRRVVKWRSNLTEIGEDPDTGEPQLRAYNEVVLVDSNQVDDATAAAIAEIAQTKDGALKVKLHSKQAALVTLLRHLTAPLSKPAEDEAHPAGAADDGWGDVLPSKH